MGTIHRLLERFGFVRLRDFGLILTADRRVVATRPALDDGFGGCVVGWEDGDLAAAELETWPAKPRPAAPPPPKLPAVAKPIVVPRPPPAPVQPPAVADEPEDEWEWEIAAARARAVAEPVPVPLAAPVIERIAPITQSWIVQEQTSETWNDEAPTRTAPRATPQPEHLEATRRTIIPVPSLPIVDARLVKPLDDHTRSMLPVPRRFPRSTHQQAAQKTDDYTSPTVASLPSRMPRR